LQGKLASNSDSGLLINLEPLAPGLYSCPRAHIADTARALGTVEFVSPPETVTGLREYNVRTPDGAIVKIREQLPVAGANVAGAASATSAPITVNLPWSSIPKKLEAAAAQGARIEKTSTADGVSSYEVTYKDGRIERINDSQRSGFTPRQPVSEATAAANHQAAAHAENIQAQRNAQAEALIATKQAKQGFVEIPHVIQGGGQGAVMDAATLRGTSNVPGAPVTEIPSVVNMASGGSTLTKHEHQLGQSAAEYPVSDGLKRHPAEFQPDAEGFLHSKNFQAALTMTGYESGMVTVKGTIIKFEQRPASWQPGDPPWPSAMKFRLTTAQGHVIYTDRIDMSTGLGAPRPIDGGKVVGPAQLALEQSGRLVHAQEALHLPDNVPVQSLAVVGNGATSGWAVTTAITRGAKIIHWIAFEPRHPAPPAIEADMMAAGFSKKQAVAFAPAWNKINQPAFAAVKTGKVVMSTSSDTVPVLTPDGNHVVVAGHTVDGAVMGIGSLHQPVPGMQNLWYRAVTRMYQGELRVVALEAVDAAGNAIGIRKVGSEVSTTPSEQIVAHKAPSDGIQSAIDEQAGTNFRDMITKQSKINSVPTNSQGVPGSIHQNVTDIPLANKD
jgi:hypothetical protein